MLSLNSLPFTFIVLSLILGTLVLVWRNTARTDKTTKAAVLVFMGLTVLALVYAGLRAWALEHISF
jgi:hypothetical protein